MPFDLALLPPDLSPLLALSLVALSFLASLITATFSLGGGSLMVVVLALVFPPAVVVPVHGVIQLGSNGGRAVLQRDHVQWGLVRWLLLGAAIGTVLGAQIVAMLPERVFQAAIAVFILVTTWLPQPKAVSARPGLLVAGGAIVSALGMVVGAVGPLIAVFLRGLQDRRQLVATHAALMTGQNTLKVAAFLVLGFSFAQYLPLLLGMISAGFAGTAVGTRLLLKMPEKAFRYGFRIILSLVALDLLRAAIF